MQHNNEEVKELKLLKMELIMTDLKPNILS